MALNMALNDFITFFTSSSVVITMIRTPDVEKNKKNQIILDVGGSGGLGLPPQPSTPRRQLTLPEEARVANHR